MNWDPLLVPYYFAVILLLSNKSLDFRRADFWESFEQSFYLNCRPRNQDLQKPTQVIITANHLQGGGFFGGIFFPPFNISEIRIFS